MTRRNELTTEDRESQQASLTALMENVNAEKGNALTFLEGTTGLWPAEKIIRTGSLELDLAIGVGGIPRGRVVELFGQESSGKTTTCLHIVAEAQRVGSPVVYIDAENALDPNYCKALGVDLSLMLINSPDSLQQAMDLMAYLMENVNEGAGMVIVTDSIPALAPMEVMESSAEQQTRALSARYWSAQLPKLSRLAARTNTTIILINQMRDSMDMYTPASTPGGRAIKFYSSVRIQISRKVEGKNEQEGSSGQTTNLNVIKNKVSSPFRKASYWLPAGQPIDWVQDVLEAASKLDVIHFDQKWDEGEVFNKKGWNTYVLKPGDLALMKMDEPDLEDYNEESGAIVVYRWNGFEAEMRRFPSLISAIETRCLETLNKGVSSTSADSTDSFGDDVALEGADEPEDEE